MRLLSIQPAFVYEEYLKKGVDFIAKKDLSLPPEDDFYTTWKTPYEWMREQLVQKTTEIAPKDPSHYPIWAWVTDKGLGVKNDLRTSFFKQWVCDTPEKVVIEFNAPDSIVLISGYHSWHAPLNGWYLTHSAQKANAFNAKAKKLGFNSYGNPHPLSDELLSLEIKESWTQIFDEKFNIRFERSSAKKILWQAVLWRIPFESICSVKRYTSK